jgi:hypothetical protein
VTGRVTPNATIRSPVPGQTRDERAARVEDAYNASNEADRPEEQFQARSVVASGPDRV